MPKRLVLFFKRLIITEDDEHVIKSYRAWSKDWEHHDEANGSVNRERQ